MESLGTGYKSYWVGYFDLLGFENRVKTQRAIWPIRGECQTVQAEMQKNAKEIHRKWFSDTILFYTPDDSRTSFGGIQNACESFFYRMTERQIPVRGCLTVGDFYAEDDMLVGPALIEAYRFAERQDWLGFVLSPEAVRRRDQYGIPGDHYREYDVPVDHSRGTERLGAFILSSRFPMCCLAHQWWMCLHDMEHTAMTWASLKKRREDEGQVSDPATESERDRVLRKYRNSKKYILTLYPQLADVVQGEYGPIPLNKPEVRRKVRELSRRLS